MADKARVDSDSALPGQAEAALRRHNGVTGPKVLVVGPSAEIRQSIVAKTPEPCEVIHARTPLGALACLSSETFDAVYFTSDHLQQAYELGKLLQTEQILEGMPDGVVLLDSDNQIVCQCELRQWSATRWQAKTFTTFSTAPRSSAPTFALPRPWPPSPSTSTLRSSDHSYFHVHAVPVRGADGPPSHLIVTVRDVTLEIHQQQKLAAIHQAAWNWLI